LLARKLDTGRRSPTVPLWHKADLCRRHGMKPVEAYMLCSVCADLRISSIVDMPNWVVSMYFPRVVFE
jgi:acetamidase/formamidase